MTNFLNMTNFFVYLTIASCFLCLILYDLPRNTLDNISTIKLYSKRSWEAGSDSKNSTQDVFAVIGADLNPTYLFPLPITVRAWRRLGAGTIVCLVGRKKEYEANEPASIVLRMLRADQVPIIFLSSALAPSHTIAQTCRIFVAASPDIDLPDESILITFDSDLWQFKLNIPTGHQMMFLYNSMCCGLTSKPNSTKKFRMYPMGTIAMSAQLWREIMGIEKGWLINGDTLVKRLYEEFGVNYIQNGTGKPNISASWYADQIMISEKIDIWMKTRNESKIEVGQLAHVNAKTDRLDRSSWKELNKDFDLSKLRDAHILHPLHTETNWKVTLFLMEKLFDSEEMDQLKDYHQKFIQSLKKTS